MKRMVGIQIGSSFINASGLYFGRGAPRDNGGGNSGIFTYVGMYR